MAELQSWQHCILPLGCINPAGLDKATVEDGLLHTQQLTDSRNNRSSPAVHKLLPVQASVVKDLEGRIPLLSCRQELLSQDDLTPGGAYDISPCES